MESGEHIDLFKKLFTIAVKTGVMCMVKKPFLFFVPISLFDIQKIKLS